MDGGDDLYSQGDPLLMKCLLNDRNKQEYRHCDKKLTRKRAFREGAEDGSFVRNLVS